MVRIWPLIREICKGDNSAVVVAAGNLNVKANKHPFQEKLNCQDGEYQ